MQTNLLFALQVLARLERSPARRANFVATLNRTIWGRCLLLSLTKNFWPVWLLAAIAQGVVHSVSIFRSVKSGQAVGFLVRESDRRYMAWLEAVLEQKLSCLEPKHVWPRHLSAFIIVLRMIGLFYRARRILVNTRHRHDVLVLWRFTTFLGSYPCFLEMMRRYRPRFAVVANDHSPLHLAFSAAARYHAVPTVYMQHGHVTKHFPRLNFDLSILYGAAAKDVYMDVGHSSGTIVYGGIPGVHNQMRVPEETAAPITVGIFPTYLVGSDLENKVRKCIGDLLQLDWVDRVVVRHHPGTSRSDYFTGERITETSADTPIEKCVHKMGLAIAGNSSVHLDIINLGVPTIYLPELDHIDEDYFGFVRNGAIPRAESAKAISLDAIEKFYDSAWRKRFSYYDGGYEVSPQVIEKQVRKAIGELL